MIIKRYPIEKSPLYGLKSRKRLLEIFNLGLSYKELSKLSIDSDKYYNQFDLITKKGKKRPIKTPLGKLKAIHKTLAKLLGRIETPDYLMSKKGYSYKTNAEYHKGSDCVFTTDISDFFPSCLRKRLAFSLKEHFCMSGDMAFLVSNLLTCDNRITQGSHTSNLTSFRKLQLLYTDLLF